MRVFEAVSELIARSGLRVVFGLPGSANVAWLGYGIEKGRLQYIGTRHEGTAVTSAVAFSKVTGHVGLVTTTLGPGFANTVNSMAAAAHDHVPVVLIVGQSPSSKAHGDAQSLNQREIAEAVGVGFHQASKANEIEAAYWAAMEAATWNGSLQVLSIDEALMDTELELTEKRAVEVVPPAQPDPESVSAAVDALAAAQRPLVLAGRGAALASCHDEVVELADLIGARVATTLGVNRFFAGHPRDMGVCGKSSSPIVAEQLYDTDVVLAIGASLNTFTTREGGIFPRAKILQCEIDVDRDFKASSSEFGLLGDAKQTVLALTAEWKRRGLEARDVPVAVPSWEDMRTSMLKTDLGHDPSRGLDPRAVYAHFDDKLPRDRIVVTDGGRAGLPLPAMLNAQDHFSFVPSRGYGSIGLGVGAAIGVAIAAPDRPVVLFCGDGGFMMAAQELDTIRSHQLSVTIVIMDDLQYGSEIKYLNRLGLRHEVAKLSMPDIELLARAYGGEGVVIQSDDELGAIDVTKPGLYIVDARIDPHVDPANM